MRLLGTSSTIRFNRTFDYNLPERKNSLLRPSRKITVVAPESGSRRVASRNVTRTQER